MVMVELIFCAPRTMQEDRLFLSNGKGFDDLGPLAVADGPLQHSNNQVRFVIGDFNGDGRADLLRTSDDGKKDRLFLSNGKGFDDAGPVTVVDGPLQHSNYQVRIA